MKKSKKSNSKHLQVPAMALDDGESSTTAVTTESDDNASDNVTLVDFFPGLAIGDLFEADDNLTSAESSAAPSSEVSTDNQSTPSADANGSETDLKTAGKKGKNGQNQNKGKAQNTESDSGISADTSSAEASTSAEESASSQASSAEAAMARSTTSGETTSNKSSTSGDASSESGGASSSAQSSNTGHWTPSEDALIISMKEGGETWASIGKAINRGKNEVKKRWHVAKANAANSESGGDAQTESESAGANSQTESMADSQEGHKADEKFKSRAERKAERKAEQKKNKGKTTLDNKTKESRKSHSKPKHLNHEAEEQQPSETSEMPSTPNPPSSNSIGDSPSSSLRNRLALLRDTTSASSSTSSATSNDGDDGDDASDSSARCYDRELARQERYIRRHVNPALYPPRSYPLMPPPNAIRPPSHADKRQRREDKILASLVSRREATKWLEMQANFYNVTGRMVPLHMIKARCEAEEDRSKVAGVRNWATSVADGDELLDPNECADVPEDALVENDEE